MARKLIPLKSPDSGYSKDLLGGKGYNLWKMAQAGVNVPPAMIISTEVCREFMADPESVEKWVRDEAIPAIKMYLSKEMGYMPLVSVRSGSKFSMPGMMDTILNVGLDGSTADFWVAKLGVNCLNDSTFRLRDMYKKVVGVDCPNSLDEQLFGAIIAVFKSWNNERAKVYRKMNGISDDLGTAVTVQAMVFGNLNDASATGVMFTRDPSSGANEIVGEFLINAQGEDVVAGVRTPLPMSKLAEWNPSIAAQLMDVASKLEAMNRDMQDIEFTVQDGKLFILQTRDAKRTSQAAVVVALDFWNAGLINAGEMVARVKADDILNASRPGVDPVWFKDNPAHAKGLAASPGVVFGKAVFSAAQAVIEGAKGPVILITKETDPDDLAGMAAAVGILTGRGGMTSHAAVVARGMNKPAVVGCGELNFSDLSDAAGHPSVLGVLKMVAIDGATGNVWFGSEPKVVGGATGAVKDFLSVMGDHYGYYEVALKAADIVNAKRVVLPAYAMGVAEMEAEAAKMVTVVDDLIIDLREASVDPDSAPLAMLFGLPYSDLTDKVMALIGASLKCKVILPNDAKIAHRANLTSSGYKVVKLINSVAALDGAMNGELVIADHKALAGEREAVAKLVAEKSVKSLNCVSEVTAAMLASKGKLAVAPILAAISILS